MSSGQLSGSVHGRSDQAIYIPSIFTDMQNQWIDNFLSANGYLGELFHLKLFTYHYGNSHVVYMYVRLWYKETLNKGEPP